MYAYAPNSPTNVFNVTTKIPEAKLFNQCVAVVVVYDFLFLSMKYERLENVKKIMYTKQTSLKMRKRMKHENIIHKQHQQHFFFRFILFGFKRKMLFFVIFSNCRSIRNTNAN